MNSNDMNYLVDTVAEGFVDSMMKLATKKSKPLDRTYTGRIMSIGENNKCQVMFSNKSCWVEMDDDNIHYINELVRVYIPNGDIDKAYGESVTSVPCSKIIISPESLTFKSTVKAPIFSEDNNREPIVEVTEIDFEKVIKITKDSNDKITSAIFPNGNIIEVEYKDKGG